MKICPKCNNEHEKLGKFCSRKCSNSRIWLEEDKLKKSIAAKNSEKVKEANKNKSDYIKKLWQKGVYKSRKQLFTWVCPVCSKELYLRNFEIKKRKYCSGKCRNKINNALIYGSRSKAERYLEEKLKISFPTLTIEFNTRKVLSDSKELDVFIPSLNLAIEWNGVFHYCEIRKGELLKIKMRDSEKAQECKEKGIELITIKDLTSNNKFIKQEIEKLISLIQARLV